MEFFHLMLDKEIYLQLYSLPLKAFSMEKTIRSLHSNIPLPSGGLNIYLVGKQVQERLIQ